MTVLYDQDSDEERLAHARLVAESLVPDMEIWRREMVEWAGGGLVMRLWLECLAWEEE